MALTESGVLIVLYGIETPAPYGVRDENRVLIVLYGIETNADIETARGLVKS